MENPLDVEVPGAVVDVVPSNPVFVELGKGNEGELLVEKVGTGKPLEGAVPVLTEVVELLRGNGC